tara:strand:- start:6149 stop:6985 length:837 start_codon:yes stop_codon:yes gene_type:complete
MLDELSRLVSRRAELQAPDRPIITKAIETHRLIRDTQRHLASIEKTLTRFADRRNETLRTLGAAVLEDPDSIRITGSFTFGETMSRVELKTSELEKSAVELEMKLDDAKQRFRLDLSEKDKALSLLKTDVELLARERRTLPDTADTSEMDELLKERMQRQEICQLERDRFQSDGLKEIAQINQTLIAQQRATDAIRKRGQSVQRDLGRAILESSIEQKESEHLTRARMAFNELNSLSEHRDLVLEHLGLIDRSALRTVLMCSVVGIVSVTLCLWIFLN